MPRISFSKKKSVQSSKILAAELGVKQEDLLAYCREMQEKGLVWVFECGFISVPPGLTFCKRADGTLGLIYSS